MTRFMAFLLAAVLFSSSAFAGETYDRVMKSGTIRCGYALWTPILYKDSNTGKIKGITYDLMEEAAKRLDLKIEWAEETGWGTMIEGMNTGRYDMICNGLGRSSTRGKFISFGTPLFYMPMYVVAKVGDDRFSKDINVLNSPDYKIGVLEGELSAIVSKQIFPAAVTSAMPQINDYSMLLKEVETGKADVTLVEPSVFKLYEASNPGKLRMLDKMPVSTFPVGVGLPRDDVAFNNVINYALEELLNDGTVERVLKKHAEHPEAFLRVAKPYVSSPK